MLTAEQLRMARAALRLTVKALAGLAGVDEGTIIRIEAGKRSYKRTLKDLRESLEQRGVVFLDAVEGAHRPGVALGWGEMLDEDGDDASDDATGKPGEGLDARSWDEDFADLPPAPARAPLPDFPPFTEAEREEMRQYYRDNPERWARISAIGKACLARTMGLNDSTTAP